MSDILTPGRDDCPNCGAHPLLLMTDTLLRPGNCNNYAISICCHVRIDTLIQKYNEARVKAYKGEA